MLAPQLVQRAAAAAEQKVAGGVPVAVVRLLEAVHVADEQGEPALAAAAPLEVLLEGADVQQAGQVIALRERAEAIDEVAVAAREPADQDPARDVRERADPGRAS